MTDLTDAQVWVLIGVFGAAIFGMLGIVTTSFNRTLTAAIGGVRSEIGSVRTEIGSVRAEIGSVRAEIDGVRSEIGGVRSEVGGLRSELGDLRTTMNARFEAMDTKFTNKFDLLDRDVQALSRHVFGADPR